MARINRWMAAGAAVLAGGTSLIAWHGFRAHTAGLARAAARRAAPSHRHGDDGGSPPEGPAAPRSAPAAAPTPAPAAPAVSGGS